MGRAFLLSSGALGAALGAVVILALSRDSSPLGGLPDPFAVARDVPYGPAARQTLDVAFARAPSRPRPALVMIHPGGWMQGDKSACHALMAEYAGLGYVTVAVNFRLSGSAPYPAALADCKRAVRWLRAHAADYGIDPSRIGVTGWSSGAHLAMLVALSDDGFEREPGEPVPSSRVQAAVCASGVYDFLMEERGPYPNAEDDPAVVRFLGGPPRERPELARRASPGRHLSTDDPPLLVFHGELDRRIDAEQARQFALALRRIGREDEVVVLPGADHGRDLLPADPAGRRRVREFFDRHLRPGE
jgi:acetyl esterase/lipase